MNIIIGGGRASTILLNYLTGIPDISITGIADIKSDSPGIQLARELGIHTTNDFNELLGNPKTNLLFELTGNTDIRAKIREKMLDSQELITSNSAKLMCDMISGEIMRTAKNAENVSSEFDILNEKFSHTIENIDDAHATARSILRGSELVALNGKIEAARAGELGAAFGVVVGSFGDMINQIKKALIKIEAASHDCTETLDNLRETERKLKETFSFHN